MAKTVKEAYGEIVRLRNEAYKKWIETPTDDEYNRVVTKAKFQAYEECMKFDGWNYLLKRNEELVRENTSLKNYLRQVYFLMQNIKENEGVSLDLMTKIASLVGTIEETLNFDK